MSSESSESSKPGEGQPQLKMRFRAFAGLAPVRLAPAYALATLAQRSLAEWIAVLNATGQLGAWDDRRAGAALAGERPVLAAGTYLILAAGRAVATACTIPPTPAESRSELGWVAVAPSHQGRGLGLQVCRAVLWYARRRGWPATTLNTNDWRLPAIRTYLKLGFEPEFTHASHRARWQAIRRQLGAGPPGGGLSAGAPSGPRRCAPGPPAAR